MAAMFNLVYCFVDVSGNFGNRGYFGGISYVVVVVVSLLQSQYNKCSSLSSASSS
jgi:hypothetical protein